jgi:hypothetical protein
MDFVKRKYKVFPVLNYAPHYEYAWRSGNTAPCILNLGSGCMWMVSFTYRPSNAWGTTPRYPLDRKLGGPQSRSGHSGGEETKILAAAGERTPVTQPVAQSLHWLSYLCSWSQVCFILQLSSHQVILIFQLTNKAEIPDFASVSRKDLLAASLIFSICWSMKANCTSDDLVRELKRI